MSTTLGSFVTSDLLDQIKLRGEIQAKSGKSSEELQYLYTNAPWICLRPGAIYNKDDSFGQKNTLWGGGFVDERESQLGIQYTGGINFEGSQDRTLYAYNPASEELRNAGGDRGFTPPPGITGLTVRTKDTWGCILEAEVKIKCWSLDDLDILSKLYFKLGFSALLEWGHSMVLQNSGELFVPTGAGKVIDWYGTTKRTMQDINTLIRNKRKQLSGNYEGMCGYVTNYSWKFQKNGSFDCTLKILSPGSVIFESTLPDLSSGDKQEEGSSEKTGNSFLVEVLSSLENSTPTSTADISWNIDYQEDSVTGDEDVDCTKRRESVVNEIVTEKDSKGNIVRIGFDGKDLLSDSQKKILNESFYVFQVIRSNTRKSYIRFSDFLWMLNKVCSFNSGGNINTGFDIYNYYRFASFKGMFSLDPQNVFLANNEPAVPEARMSAEDTILKQGLPKKYSDWYYIGNIFLSVSLLKEILKEVFEDGAKSSANLSTLLSKLCNRVADALGNVNNFSVHIVDNLISVVDRNCIVSEDESNFEIPLAGLESTVTSLDMTSDITADMAGVLSIAAAANGVNSNLASIFPAMKILAGNCEDRLQPIVSPSSEKKASEAPVVSKSISSKKKGSTTGTKTGRTVAVNDQNPFEIPKGWTLERPVYSGPVKNI